MARIDDILPLLKPALVKFMTYLTGDTIAADETLDALAKRYADSKGKQGRDAVASKIGMNEAELTLFDAALREGVRRSERLTPEASSFEQRNVSIAALRLLSWIETISDRKPEFQFSAELPGQNDEVGRKQVRALELIIRSLITENYQDQPKLVERLKSLLSDKVVQQWMSSADKNDVLSGTTFSELASLFVSTQEYPNYDPLYKETPLLSLLKEKRVTIRNYLDDIRRIRNVLAHNKRVTPAQMALLNMYYDELIEPLQEAHDQGRIKLNPETYLNVSKEELSGYFTNLKDDVKGVKDDIAELRTELGGKLDDVKKDTAAIRETTTRIEGKTDSANRKIAFILAAVIGVLAVLGLVFWIVKGTGEKTDQIADTTKRTEQKTDEIKGSTDRIEEKTGDIKDSTDRIEESQKRTEEKLGEIADAFKRIDKNGGVIENASSPAEHYHNAIVYEQRGDSAAARKEYLAFAEADVDAIDVYERFARLVRVQDGRAGARELFGDLSSRLKAPALKLVYAMQYEDAERTKRMEEFMAANADYGPGYYLLAQEYSAERTGGQAVADKKRAFELLNKFLDADKGGTLVRHFVDQQVLGEWLDKARQQVKLLKPQLQETLTKPTITQSRSNQGWTIIISIPEAASQIWYRIGESGEWTDLGVGTYVDPRTGKPMPNMFFMLPDDQPATKIYIKYVDANGAEQGPFDYDFGNGASALVDEQKRTMEMIWTSWFVIQPNPGNEAQMLAYFTGMVSYRCAVEKVMYSVDSDALDKELVLPPCDSSDPYAIPSDFMPYFEVSGTIQKIVAQVTYKDGTQSAKHEYKPKK